MPESFRHGIAGARLEIVGGQQPVPAHHEVLELVEDLPTFFRLFR